MTDEVVVRIRHPMKIVWRWSARLARPIVLKDGTRLRDVDYAPHRIDGGRRTPTAVEEFSNV